MKASEETIVQASCELHSDEATVEGPFPVLAHRVGIGRTLRAHQVRLLLADANLDAEAPPVWRQVSA
ncbi:MAG: hypothetical protein JO099_13305 [Acidobacteriia bacterium]|nr:hypothetical protein [Terriglobia bacterium]